MKKEAGAPRKGAHPGWGSRSCPSGAEQNGSATRQADPYGGLRASTTVTMPLLRFGLAVEAAVAAGVGEVGTEAGVYVLHVADALGVGADVLIADHIVRYKLMGRIRAVLGLSLIHI